MAKHLLFLTFFTQSDVIIVIHHTIHYTVQFLEAVPNYCAHFWIFLLLWSLLWMFLKLVDEMLQTAPTTKYVFIEYVTISLEASYATVGGC